MPKYLSTFLLLFFSLCVIILYMGLFTWGSLPKAQDDPTLIDEAIATAIANHEADPTAHLGDGESLQQHKNNEIIDHPAYSIVSDKYSQVQKLFSTFFESTDSWYKQGHFASELFRLSLTVFGNDTQDTYGWIENVSFSVDNDDLVADNFLDFNFFINNFYSIADVYIGIGVVDEVPDTGFYIAIKISNGVLYTGIVADGSISWVSYGSLPTSSLHTFRFATFESDHTAQIFLDGVSIASVDLSSADGTGFGNFGIYLHKTGGTTNAQATGIYATSLYFFPS